MQLTGEDKESPESVEMNLTPMIDVTFQLIVFFMLVMDFSSRELEPVVLTEARNATLDEQVEDYTVTVNITHKQDVKCDRWSMDPRVEGYNKICRDEKHWMYYIKGQGYESAEQIRNILATRARAKLGENNISEVPLIVRADSRAPWQFVRQVMQQASHPDVKMYKLKLAAKISRSSQ